MELQSQPNVNVQAPLEKRQSYRFDIFKGEIDEAGSIRRLRSVGAAHIVEGVKTYTVHLKTFLKDVFYLLPEEKKLTTADFLIYTREPSIRPGRKYFWNQVGEGKFLEGSDKGFMRLSFDVLGSDSLFMNLHPKETTPTAPKL